MISVISCFLGIGLYAVTGYLCWKHYRASDSSEDHTQADRSNYLISLCLGMLAHIICLQSVFWLPDGLNVHIVTLLSLIILAVFSALLLLRRRLDQRLMILTVLPLAVFSIAVLLFPGEPVLLSGLDRLTVTHVLSSLLAYSILSIAALLALQLFLQHWMLKRHQRMHWISDISITSAERFLFQLLLAGVILLGISLISGFIYIDNLFAQHLIHKTLLSLLAWCFFAGLLFGRWRYGWRGLLAVKLTLAGMLLLLLAYFGSKFVLEILLKQDWQV